MKKLSAVSCFHDPALHFAKFLYQIHLLVLKFCQNAANALESIKEHDEKNEEQEEEEEEIDDEDEVCAQQSDHSLYFVIHYFQIFFY